MTASQVDAGGGVEAQWGAVREHAFAALTDASAPVRVQAERMEGAPSAQARDGERTQLKTGAQGAAPVLHGAAQRLRNGGGIGLTATAHAPETALQRGPGHGVRQGGMPCSEGAHVVRVWDGVAQPDFQSMASRSAAGRTAVMLRASRRPAPALCICAPCWQRHRGARRSRHSPGLCTG